MQTIEPISNKNILWINISKAIGILLVYFFHTEFYMGIDLGGFSNYYTPFFTNIFFFISGYLLFRKQLSSNMISKDLKSWMSNSCVGGGTTLLKNILCRIAIPTIIFSSVLFIPKNIIRGIEFDTFSFLHDTILGGSIWFTCALTIAELIVFIFLLTRNNSLLKYFIVSLVLCIIAVLFSKDSNGVLGTNNIPWFWKGGFIASMYLVLGGIYYKYEDLIDKIISNKKSVILISITIVYCGIITLWGGQLNMSINVGNIHLFGTLVSFLAILLVVYITKTLPSNKFTNYLGRNTLPFYFLSGAIPNIISIIVLRYTGASVFVYILVSILSFLIAMPIVVIINRYFPFMLDLRLLRNYRKKQKRIL